MVRNPGGTPCRPRIDGGRGHRGHRLHDGDCFRHHGPHAVPRGGSHGTRGGWRRGKKPIWPLRPRFGTHRSWIFWQADWCASNSRPDFPNPASPVLRSTMAEVTGTVGLLGGWCANSLAMSQPNTGTSRICATASIPAGCRASSPEDRSRTATFAAGSGGPPA